jgi:phospholipid/cholesterol/gamma-HCH transport system substrate-binding protein
MSRTFSKSTQVLVGAISLAIIGIMILLAFQGNKLFAGAERVYQAEFSSVLNVVPQASDVRVNGITIGSVSSVESKGDFGLVTFGVEPDIELKADASAKLRLKSFLGEKYVEVSPGTSAEPLRGPIKLDQTSTAADLGNVLGKSGASLGGIPSTEVTETLKLSGDTLNDNGGKIASAIENLRIQTDLLVGSQGELYGTLEATDQALATLVAQGETIGQVSANAQATLERFKTFAAREKVVMLGLMNDLTTLRGVFEDNKTGLTATADEVPATLGLVRKLVNQLSANIATGRNPIPITLTNLGTLLDGDVRPPEQQPGERGENN